MRGHRVAGGGGGGGGSVTGALSTGEGRVGRSSFQECLSERREALLYYMHSYNTHH